MSESALPSWYCHDGEVGEVFRARTRGHAKALAAAEFGLDFTEVRTRRLPQIDGKPLTAQTFLECGLWLPCVRCTARVVQEDLAAGARADGDYACCADCVARRARGEEQ